LFSSDLLARKDRPNWSAAKTPKNKANEFGISGTVLVENAAIDQPIRNKLTPRKKLTLEIENFPSLSVSISNNLGI
jgi:hypothetical protein